MYMHRENTDTGIRAEFAENFSAVALKCRREYRGKSAAFTEQSHFFPLASNICKETRRGLRHTGGAVAIEFAMLLPLLLTILFAIIQYGQVLSTRQQMIVAAHQAARSYAVGESSAGEAQALAVSLMNNPALNFVATIIDDGASVVFDFSVPMAEAAIVDILGNNLMSGDINVVTTLRLED